MTGQPKLPLRVLHVFAALDRGGAETWLIDAGLIPAGSLDSLKARVLLGLLLTEGASRERIESVVATLGSPARSA